jgi:hypothetical protein
MAACEAAYLSGKGHLLMAAEQKCPLRARSALDWLAETAVASELVSAVISLILREYTGNLAAVG